MLYREHQLEKKVVFAKNSSSFERGPQTFFVPPLCTEPKHPQELTWPPSRHHWSCGPGPSTPQAAPHTDILCIPRKLPGSQTQPIWGAHLGN